jgi:pectate lyase
VSTPPSGLIGWAKTDKCGPKGTTGGGDGPATVTVTSTSELVAALSAAGPKVIEVKGTMKGARLKDSVEVKDKTVIGTNSAFISDGMRIDKGHNLIFKNIRFGESKVVGGDDNLADGFTLQNTTCVWIDHCEFMNSIDGNLDIVGDGGLMTSWVTVSWSKFWYTADNAANVNKVHRFSNLIVGSDDKPNPLPYVTYHHNWWAENVIERMPRGRWAWAHVFNNYYSTQGNNYGIGVSVGIQFVVENNFFEPGFEDPVYYFNKDQGAAVRLSGNKMDGVVWKDTQAADAAFGTAFNPADHYSYTLQSPEDAKASVMAGAGVK